MESNQDSWPASAPHTALLDRYCTNKVNISQEIVHGNEDELAYIFSTKEDGRTPLSTPAMLPTV